MDYHGTGKSTGSETTDGSLVNRQTFLTAAGTGTVGTVAGCLGGSGSGGLKVGLLTPQAADVGVGAERMAQLYVEQLNEGGGIMDEEVELLVADIELSPSAANSAVQDFLQEGVNRIAGTFASETALAVMERIGQSDTMFFTGGPASTQIVQDFPGEDYGQYKNVCQMCTNPIDQAEGYADYAAFLSDTHGWNEFSVMVEDAAWTEAITEITAARMEEEYGLTVNSNSRVARDTSDWSPLLDDVDAHASRWRLEIVKAIATEPDVLLLDEPFAGLNHEEVMSLSDQIRSLRDEGMTIVVVDHNMKGLMTLVDRVVVLNEGSLLADTRRDRKR